MDPEDAKYYRIEFGDKYARMSFSQTLQRFVGTKEGIEFCAAGSSIEVWDTRGTLYLNQRAVEVARAAGLDVPPLSGPIERPSGATLILRI